MILCGGRGTRLQEHTRSIPKPMVEIGGRPILWHVIQIYLAQGFRQLPAADGYRGEQIAQFVDARAVAGRRRDPLPRHRSRHAHRAAACTSLQISLRGSDFCLTYADGVADIDLGALLEYHARHAAPATMTVVRPELQFGVAELDADGGVPALSRSRGASTGSTAGSSACGRPVLELLSADAMLEREPLRAAGGDRQAARLPARRLLGVHGHLQGRGRAQRPVGARATRRGSCGIERSGRPHGARHRRPRAARRAGWSRRCSSAGAAWSRSAATSRPHRRSRCSASRRASTSSTATSVRRGWSAGAQRVRGRQRLSPRRADASSAPPTARRCRRSRPTSGAPGCCSRRAGARRRERSSSRPRTRPTAARRSCRTPRTPAARARLPVRRLEGRRRPDRPLLLAHVRAAGRGDAVREPLRRWRHEPLAAGPRGDRRGARAAARR